MRYEFHPEARLEFRESAAFYEGCRAGLGVAFSIEIESVLSRILETPDRFPFLEDDVRRCLARRFPYGILYTIEADTSSSSQSCTAAGNRATGATGCMNEAKRCGSALP